MNIEGTVSEIIFRNNENNYTVLLLSVNGEAVTCVGHFPYVSEGEYVELSGTFTAHSKYGEQFSVSGVKLTPPTTSEGIVKYLSSGLIKGVGPITATNIVNKFGVDTLDIIAYNPTRLSEIKGISPKKAVEIADCYNSVKAMQNAIMLMQHYNISTNLAIRIYTYYGTNTENVIKTNPYRLVEDVDGIGFFTADKIAQNIGIKSDSEFRFRAGVMHVLKENSDKCGNTYVTRPNMEEELATLLRLNIIEYGQVLKAVLDKLVSDGQIKQFERGEDSCVMLTKFYNIEKYIGATLKLLVDNTTRVDIDVDSIVHEHERIEHITLDSTQIEAVKMATTNGCSVITGGPGTGKTTIIKCVLSAFNAMGRKVCMVAPTGRAAKRLTESCGENASTIHRALEVDYSSSLMFKYNNLNKLPYDVVIVDEVSMVDSTLMYYLVRALKKNAQLILVGDKDQLPSVGAGNVLSDILESNIVPKMCLSQIYRQDKNSLIITNAHAINDGEMPVLDNSSNDFFYSKVDEPNMMLNTVIEMCTERIPKFLGVDPITIQVLAPMKAGVCGVDNINKCLQEKLNPASAVKYEIVNDKYIFRQGDRVMQITNNYERELTTKYGYKESGVFNGDIGVVSFVDPSTNEVCVEFDDGRTTRYAKADLGEIVLSYAVTIHKSQGSEFDCVIIPVVGGPPMLLTRNLLYTAVTRAKRMVVLIGSKMNIRRMIKNNYTQKRFTLLKDFLTMDKEYY